jgi:hypothetical protein
MQNREWDRTRVKCPRGSLTALAKIKRAIPRAISGIKRGRIITPWMALCILSVTDMATMALAVPSMADTSDVITATSILMRKAAPMTLSLNSCLYQLSVRPVHWAVEGLALKE